MRTMQRRAPPRHHPVTARRRRMPWRGCPRDRRRGAAKLSGPRRRKRERRWRRR
ncbi:MAG: hypothetical protein MZW92_69285 [Comamonadaceae bacterium]|nr:hypothetical protein [Comamonadaceae bacterium]